MIAYWATLGVLATVSPMIKRRIELSRAKHRSLAGHSRSPTAHREAETAKAHRG